MDKMDKMAGSRQELGPLHWRDDDARPTWEAMSRERMSTRSPLAPVHVGFELSLRSLGQGAQRATWLAVPQRGLNSSTPKRLFSVADRWPNVLPSLRRCTSYNTLTCQRCFRAITVGPFPRPFAGTSATAWSDTAHSLHFCQKQPCPFAFGQLVAEPFRHIHAWKKFVEASSRSIDPSVASSFSTNLRLHVNSQVS
jgi:hypothetical protein